MLADDELDFDYDLGDLGDLGDLEATGLTTEELEKELGLDLDIDLEPITEDSFKKKTPSKETPSEKPKVVSQDSKNDIKPKAITKEEDKKTDDKKTEVKKEGQDNSIKQNATPKESDQEEKKQDQLKKPERKSIPTTLDKQHNNYRNNRNFNNNNPMNFYAMQQQAMFYPQMQSNFMAMNGMFPYQQQQNFSTPNRIYVNPNFKGRNPNQMMGRQQVEETQKANNTKPNMTDEEKAREELLDQKRKEAAESLRKKLASKKQEAGTKRKNPDSPTSEAKRPATESIQIKPAPSNGGFSIRGAAKAKATEAMNTNIRKLATQPIVSRLGRREQASPIARASPSPSKAAPVSSSKELNSAVTITSLSPNTTLDTLKTLVKQTANVFQVQYSNGEDNATVLFDSKDTAVKFRRMHNRTKFGDSHIVITLKK